MNRPDSDLIAVRNMLQAAYIEVMPLRGVEDQLQFLPTGAGVTVTCSPSKGIEATLKLAERLSQRNFHVVPHLAARQVADTRQLKDILDRLTECGINALFVPGGDIEKPVGKFDSALQLLRAMSNIEHGIGEIGVAAYPERHPLLDDQTLAAALRSKQEVATYCVTQMCFSGEAITSWLTGIREQGIHLPVWIGLPGAIERNKLIDYSLRVGVGDSARFAKRRPKLVRKLLAANTYQPDDLVWHLAPHLGQAPQNIAGLHLFSFNQVESTQNWRMGFLDDLTQQNRNTDGGLA